MKNSILIVDDDLLTLNLLEMIFESADFEVLVANSGMNAIEQTAKRQPDAILLDIMMPNMSGVEVCQIIREQEKMADVPIIFLTTCTQTKAIEASENAGATSYLIKPTPRHELVKAVRNALVTSLPIA
ncbi:MAG: response regulator [Chloroflexi bacterium]|nr:response regulator [Chloroflexota bacterium]